MSNYFTLRSPQQQASNEINRISRQIGLLLAEASQLDWSVSGRKLDAWAQCTQCTHKSDELKRQINRLVTACQDVELSVPINDTAQILIAVLDTIMDPRVVTGDSLDI